MTRGTSAHDVQHLFYAGAADARIFQTGKVMPRVLTRSQEFGQSGSRFASDSVNNSEWSEAALTGGFDLGDMTMLLASIFSSKRETNGDWNFLSMAGGRPSGYKAPKLWTKLQSYNWADTGESYEASNPVLQSLEVNYDRSGDTTVTAAFLMKQYQKITRPTNAPVAKAVDTQIIRNSDIRIGLSTGRLGAVTYPTQILRARWSFPQIVVPVFGGNQSDRGWTHYVEADLEGGFRPMLNFTFMEDDEYLKYANRDNRVFVSLSDAAGTFEWVHQARWTEQPSGPSGQGNVQEVEISLLPVARVDARAVNDLIVTFTAAAGDSDRLGVSTVTPTYGTGLARKSGNEGYLPEGLDLIAYDSTDDKLYVGSANDDWPDNWEPESITIGSGSVIPLTFNDTDNVWESGTITTSPITAGASEATIKWKWTPATFMKGFANGTGIAALTA